MGNQQPGDARASASLDGYSQDLASAPNATLEAPPAAQLAYAYGSSGSSRPSDDRGDGDLGGTAKQEAARANAQGVEMLKISRHDEAVQQFKAALNFEPGSVQILNNIGLSYAKMQDFNSAHEWYERAYQQDTGDVETLFSLAWVERKRQRFLHARDLFQKVLELQPDHVKALYLLGDILKTAHDYDGAVRCFERLVRLDPSSVDGHISLAQCYEHMKQYVQSAKLYSYVLEMDPSRLDVAFFLGRTHYLAKKYKEAVACFDRVPNTDARAFEARTYGAKAYRELGDQDRAVACAERAADIRSHPEVLHFLGEEFLRRGDQQRARHWFQRALDAEPRHQGSLLELGRLAYGQSRWDEAERHFVQLNKVEPASVPPLRYLALIKYQQKKYEPCKQYCTALLRHDALNIDALYLLAEIHRQEPPSGSTGEPRWFLGLSYPADVSVADVCQTIAEGYLSRQRLKEGTFWLQKVQHYLPSDARIKEALRQLTNPGGADPQQIIDMLDRKPGKVASSPATGSPARPVGSSGSTPGAVSSSAGPSAQVPSAAARPAEPPAEETEDLEKLVRRAERAATQPGGNVEQWREVLACARPLLRRRPDDPLVLKCAARGLLSTGGDFQEVNNLARRALEASGGDGATSGFTLGYELNAYLAVTLEREHDVAAAEKHYTLALSSKPGDEAAMLGLARVSLLHRKDATKARQLYEQVSAMNPGCAESTLKLAELSLEAGDHNEAYRWALKAAKLAPTDPSAFTSLGHVSSKLNRGDEAVKAYEHALTLKPTDAAVMLALARLQRKMGREQDAVVWFKRSLDLRPGDYECSLNLAQLHVSKGAAGAVQAQHYFRDALQCRPGAKESREIYLQISNLECESGSWREAQQTLEGAIRALPDDPELWSSLLRVTTHLQDARGRLQCLKRLVQLGAATYGHRIALGELLEGQGQIKDAREQYETARALEPGNSTALLKLANSWRQDVSQEDHLEEAKKLFEEALQFVPNNAEALDGAAYCHRKLNNLDTAIQLYQACLKVRPTGESALYYLGDILYKQHRHAECQHYLTRLVESSCSPDYKTGALYLLAKSHISLDEYEEAQRHARSGLDLKPNHPHFLFIHALVKNRVAEYDASISILQLALQHCDEGEGGGSGSDQLRVEIHDWLAQAYERKRDCRAATSQLDFALQRDPNHVSSLITKGLVHIQLSQGDQAEAAFKKALGAEKNNAMALVKLGYCRLLVGDMQEATQLFQRALQQRCGTVALPRSVKGSARVYMALAHLGQQDVDGALFQLAEARKSHRNFSEVHNGARDAIVRGSAENVVNRLRAICDLDVNAAQARQLVQLMARELGLNLKEHAPGIGNLGEAPANNAGGFTPQTSSRGPVPQAASGYPTSAQPSSTAALPILPAAPPAANSYAGLPPPPPETPTSAARRQWTAPAADTREKQWIAPVAESRPAPAAAKPDESTGGLKLESHEQIDVSDLSQGECLGTGGFGAVYRGNFHGLDVAIKKLFCEDNGNVSPLQLDELEKEVGALRSLSHPRLVRFIGACLKPPNLCIVTEFMAGGSLHHLLHRAKTPLTLGQQARMALQIAEGVAFLHSLRPPVVHRDLKSLNIVLDLQYNAKICDFGLTQSMDKTHISLKEGGNGGSPRYMAPECYDTKGKVTEKVDVWALGCILVECFGGPLPYDDCTNIQQIVAKVLIDKQPPYIPHHLPRGVRAVVEDCFLFDVKQRTGSGDVYARLRQQRLV